MPWHVLRVRPLRRFFSQQRPDETPGTGAEALWYSELTARDLGEQRRVFSVVERITADQHRVEENTEGPDVGGFARISSAGA